MHAKWNSQCPNTSPGICAEHANWAASIGVEAGSGEEEVIVVMFIQ